MLSVAVGDMARWRENKLQLVTETIKVYSLVIITCGDGNLQIGFQGSEN
jgi:hypothetical protein